MKYEILSIYQCGSSFNERSQERVRGWISHYVIRIFNQVTQRFSTSALTNNEFVIIHSVCEPVKSYLFNKNILFRHVEM